VYLFGIVRPVISHGMMMPCFAKPTGGVPEKVCSRREGPGVSRCSVRATVPKQSITASVVAG